MLQRCKKNVLRQFQAIRMLPKNSKAKSCILVLDTITAPILSDLLTLQQLLQVGIKDLCRADKTKKPDPAAIAIYYISCNSLKYLYKDFEVKAPERKKIKKQESSQQQPSQRSTIQPGEATNHPSIYYSINLLLCEYAQQKILREISEQQQVLQRIASFGQLYIPCRYTSNSIGIVPFSRTITENVQNLRRLSKSGPSMSKISSKVKDKEEEEKSEVSRRKRTTTAHHIHKDNLSCLADIHFYQKQLQQKKQSKERKKFDQIQQNLQEYGRKLSQSILAGINIGESTSVKIVCYQSKFSHKLKQSFKNNFVQFMESKGKQNIFNQNGNGEKGTIFTQGDNQPQTKQMVVIIADRTVDNLSPLIRSYLYQPILMDIFDINDPPSRKIKIISKKIAPTIIETDDKIYGLYKNMNIFSVFLKIDDNLQQYIASSKAAQFQKENSPSKSVKSNSSGKISEIQLQVQPKTKSTREIRDVIKQLPQFKKVTSSFNVNINVLNAIASLKSEKKLDEEAEIEHLIVTGYSRENKVEKDKKILEKVYILLENPIVSIEDRCRLLVLASCFLDISNDERNKLIKRLSQVEGHGDIAMGLSKLTRKGIKKYSLSSHSVKHPNQTVIDKHQCILSSLLEQLLISNNNPTKILKQFKLQQLKISSYLKKPVVKGTLTRSKQKKIQYVVCMCGGMGYNELADIQRMAKSSGNQNINVNFITDYIFTPKQYLEQLCTTL